MRSELLEAPRILKELDKNKGAILAAAESIKRNDFRSIVFVARGTSNNAAMYFKYLCEAKSGIRVSKYFHSVTTKLNKSIMLDNSAVLAVSQSGKGTDTLEVVNVCISQGANVLSLTNYADSPLAKMSAWHAELLCGEEKSVAATKTFTAQIALLTLLSNALANKPLTNLTKIAEKLEQFNENSAQVEETARKIADKDCFAVISRGSMQFIAEEFCLKLTETAYKIARAFSAAEFLHGPFAMMDERRTGILLAPSGPFGTDFIENAKKLKESGAVLVAFSDIPEVLQTADYAIKMPGTDESSPFLYTLAIQRFAETVSVSLGLNPDKPRGLNKVTVTV